MEPQNMNPQTTPSSADNIGVQSGPTGRHEKLLTEVIQKQMALLGTNIALATARSVKGLIISDQGVVTQLEGDHQQLTQQLVEQFMALSGLIVKKTMEPLLTARPDTFVHQPLQQPPSPQIPVNQNQTTTPETPVAQNTQMENNKNYGY